MGSSVLKTIRPPSKHPALVALTACLLLIACGGPDDTLRDWTCTRDDIPRNYDLRADGNANSDDQKHTGESYFSYWKQTVGDPPFDPPGEILCQVTQFADEDAAQAFSEELTTSSGFDGLAAFAWLQDSYTVTERMFFAPVGARVFEIHVDDELRIIAAVQVVDRYVQSVFQGTASGPPGTDIAADIAHLLRERTAQLVALEHE